MDEQNKLFFHETQKFSKWVRAAFILDFIVFVGIMLALFWYLRDEPFRPFLLILILAVFVIPLAILILFCLLTLETQVRSDGLYVRMFPLHLHFKKFALDEINEYYARQYKPLMEYGGWGIRYGSHGKAYNVSGNRGLQLVFKSGKKLLIGSQKPDELVEAIRLASSVQP
ncbi:MAG: DUF6141 family protein [Planctomycetaceae bacterium]|nr:DUF6141 family protein [Planctomycetaceae bacterium]